MLYQLIMMKKVGRLGFLRKLGMILKEEIRLLIMNLRKFHLHILTISMGSINLLYNPKFTPVFWGKNRI